MDTHYTTENNAYTSTEPGCRTPRMPRAVAKLCPYKNLSSCTRNVEVDERRGRRSVVGLSARSMFDREDLVPLKVVSCAHACTRS